MVIRWKFKEFYKQYGNRKTLIVLITSCFVLYAVVYVLICGRLLYHDLSGKPRPRFLCIDFIGGLANHMFQYAFAYSMAKERKLQLIIDGDNMLTKYFNIKSNTWEDNGYNRFTCYCFWRRYDKLDCGYDNSFDSLPYKDLSFHGYFQSWKYWKKFEKEIRKAFTFQSDILETARAQLQSILSAEDNSVTGRSAIIGVHIRRGDYIEPKFANFGYKVATENYIKNAVKYYKNRFKKCFFVICTNDVKWSTKVFSDEKDYYIVKGNPAAIDMALLSLTDHTIMTVGTYGWMIGLLTGGTTIFYKYPYKEDSDFATKFHSNYSDHFYPGWIAMA